jgi:uncharacterized membrane protein YfcA
MGGHGEFVLGPVQLIGLGVLGLVIGLIGGMFGLGGGFLTVPLLYVVFGVPIEQAVATGLSTGIGTAVAAWRRHSRLKQAEDKVDWLMLPGSLLGVGLGSTTFRWLEEKGVVAISGHSISAARFGISIGYVILLSFVGIWVVIDAHKRGSAPLGPGILTKLYLPPMTNLPRSGRKVSVFVLAYLGLFLGFLGGLLGLGGGILLVPILLYGIGMRMKNAAGTGILLLIGTTTLGTFQHAKHVLLVPVMLLLAGSTLAAPFGANLTSNMDGRKLRTIFGALVLVTAVAVLWNLWNSILRGPAI